MNYRNAAIDESRCRCGTPFQEADIYCRKCGTRRGEAFYVPCYEPIQILYGPRPVTRTHVCNRCGHSYAATLMVDDLKYCPQCGGETVTFIPGNARR